MNVQKEEKKMDWETGVEEEKGSRAASSRSNAGLEPPHKPRPENFFRILENTGTGKYV